ncbi:MAG: restriction endonuclease [Patescibacteria group bacterium]|nr:restriction endonuclease [Patescibacteria group bacterium]
MPRRRYRRRDSFEQFIAEPLAAIVMLYFVYLFLLSKSDPSKFWHFALIGIGIVLSVVALLATFLLFRRSQWKRLLSRIETTEARNEITNFINRFGKDKKKNSWTYYDCNFDYNRIKDFRRNLNEKGLKISEKEFYSVLRYYIGRIEYNITAESVSAGTRNLDSLGGFEFEDLLRKLYEAMGYTVQMTGKTGDQGGDLIANLRGRRLVIQAKRYKGSVGNAAVQQVVASKKYYDCSDAVVVTTGEFTRAARELAKANQVQLTGKKELQQLLSRFLKESWS